MLSVYLAVLRESKIYLRLLSYIFDSGNLFSIIKIYLRFSVTYLLLDNFRQNSFLTI